MARFDGDLIFFVTFLDQAKKVNKKCPRRKVVNKKNIKNKIENFKKT